MNLRFGKVRINKNIIKQQPSLGTNNEKFILSIETIKDLNIKYGHDNMNKNSFNSKIFY